MADEVVDAVVVGAGQAGVAMSEHLSRCGVPHLVLERDRIAERWRSGRWDSLVANGPAWHDRFPGLEFPDVEPGRVRSQGAGRRLLRRLRGEDRRTDPLRRRGDVGRSGTPAGRASASRPRTGPSTRASSWPRPDRSSARSFLRSCPTTPGLSRSTPAPTATPSQLPEGAVLVVGAGSSGVQIADELLRAGRRVYLSVGPHDRPPRRYRGRDFVWWLGVLGKWDEETPPQGKEHVTIAVSGAHGGQTVDFRDLAARGMMLVGRTSSFEDGVMHLRAGPGRQHRPRRRQLPLGARRGRRLRRAQRARPARGAEARASWARLRRA